MSLAIVKSRASIGLRAPLVSVEVHLSRGLPRFNIVGLPATGVKESRDRVRSTIMNANFEFPQMIITVNLAPADLPKEGGRFDLPIAIGILVASRQLPARLLHSCEFVGELALSGETRAIKGMLPVVLAAKQAKSHLIVPTANASEAGLVTEATVFHAKHLLDVCAYLTGKAELPVCQPGLLQHQVDHQAALNDVRGQEHAKRALEIAASGKHSLLMIGPPGTGKTMLASRLSGILPPLQPTEALESAALASISSQGFHVKRWQQIPFRAPHHSSSSVALVGGGRPPKPGEISLAHHGVLFLDELPEFNRHVLECLREPLESGEVTISRAAYQAVFPANFQLVAAMNPCPCGYAGSQGDECQCTADAIKRYQNKLSGPLLDRIDMQVDVAKLVPSALQKNQVSPSDSNDVILQRVCAARQRQLERQGKCNAYLSNRELDVFAELNTKAENALQQVMAKFNFSARVYHRLIRVARTIADLAGSRQVDFVHVSEALQYRTLDKRKRQGVLSV